MSDFKLRTSHFEFHALAIAAVLAALSPKAGQEAQGSTWQPIELRSASGQSDIDPLACRWDRADPSFRRGRANQIEVACDQAAGPSTLQCDAPGFEPHDFPARALCTSRRIILEEATLGLVNSSVPGDLTLTWFRWPDGPVAAIAARRLVSSATRISFMAKPDAFIRFSLGEFSPRTVLAKDLLGQAPTALDWQAGGELFIKHARGRIVPQAVDIVGPRSVTVQLRDDWADTPDLTAGTYTLRRVYQGGMRTPAISAVVDAGKSTDAGLPLEQVGGLHVTADVGACQAGDRIQLLRNVPGNNTVVAETRECRWTISGLAPGAYLLAVKPSASCVPEMTREVTIAAQQWTDVTLPAAAIIVCGQVTFLGEPMGNMELSFDRDVAGSQPSSVTSNTQGRGIL